MINAFISLLITGAVLFFVFVKPMQKLRALTEKPAAPAGPPEPSAEEKLLAEIRDLLKQKGLIFRSSARRGVPSLCSGKIFLKF